MKTQRILMVVGLAIALTGIAWAGDYHTGSTLTCSECHVMHASQQHGYNPDGSGFFAPPVGTNEFLLRNEVNALCLSCHDGQTFAPDVLGIQTGTVIRAAGALNDGTNAAPYFDASGHTLGSADVAPGGTFTNADGLKCVDCHQQHGYGGGVVANPWRNLLGGSSGSYAALSYETAASPTGAFDVTQLAATDYVWTNLTFNEPTADVSAYADFCKSCHTDFHGTVGGSEIGGTEAGGLFIRHPAATVNIGAIGGGHSSLAVYQGQTNQVLTQTPDGAGSIFTPSCFSCHKGHGNQNAFGLIFMSGTGIVDEQGDDGTAAKDLCGQCHVQG